MNSSGLRVLAQLAFGWTVMTLVSLPLVHGGPSVSCASSDDPCCNLWQQGNHVLNYYVELLDGHAVACANYDGSCICGAQNGNTDEAADNQADLDIVMHFFLNESCFGGQIADSPGINVRSLDFTTYYDAQICVSKCSAAKYDFISAGIPQSAVHCLDHGPSNHPLFIFGFAMTLIFITVLYFIREYRLQQNAEMQNSRAAGQTNSVKRGIGYLPLENKPAGIRQTSLATLNEHSTSSTC